MAKYRRTFLLLCLLISLLIHYGGFKAYKSLFQDDYLEIEFIEKCEDVLSNSTYELNNNSYLIVKKVKKEGQLDKSGIEIGDYVSASVKMFADKEFSVKKKLGNSLVVKIDSRKICYE